MFYEVGYAHALGKRVILLTQDASDIPFDLKHYSHIIYGGKVVDLRTDLKPQVRWFLENSAAAAQPKLEELRYFIGGSAVAPSCRISVNLEPHLERQADTVFSVDVHNTGDATFDSSSEQLGLVIASPFLRSNNRARTPDRHSFLDLGALGRILPGGWRSIPVELVRWGREGPVSFDGTFASALRVHSSLSSKRISFSLTFIDTQDGARWR